MKFFIVIAKKRANQSPKISLATPFEYNEKVPYSMAFAYRQTRKSN